MSKEDTVNPVPDRTTSGDSVLSDRLSSLDGKTVGLLSNAKKNSDHFLESVAAHLRERADVTVADLITKPTATSPADDEVYEQLAAYDVVLTAYGDCGSCSSWTMHDAIQMEKRGIPTVVFCSEEFTTLCQFEAENQECPGLPIVEFEHPIADLDPDTVREKRVTDAIVDEVVDALTDSTDALMNRYQGRYTAES